MLSFLQNIRFLLWKGQISDLIERWNVRDFDLRRVRATATIIGKKEEKGS